MNFSFQWMIGWGQNANRGTTRDFKPEEVMETLDLIFEKGGTTAVSIVNPPRISPRTLEVQTEGGQILVLLTELTEDDHCVRTLYDETRKKEKIEILGDYWDSRTLCDDIEFVKTIVNEFFETGDVSREILDGE